jgi:diguanylate cyclase (GGDEF)-like protein
MVPPHLSRAALALPLMWAWAAAGPAWALDRERSIAHHALDTWTTEQGLPRNTVEAVTRTPDGLLWFATSDGLALLEGERFRSWTHADFPEVNTLHLNAIAAGHQPGVLWLGTEGSGLLRFDYHTDSYRVYREADGLCDDNVGSLAMDQQGRLWIGTQSALACTLKDGEFTPFPLPARGGKSVLDIATDHAGGVYMAALTDALLYAPSQAATLEQKSGLPGPATAVLVDKKGAVYVGTAGFGLFQFFWDQQAYIPVAPKALGQASIRHLEQDEQGVLWVGTTGHGVIRIHPDHAEVDLAHDHLDTPLVTDLLADGEGSLWITSMGYGVKRLVDHPLHTISERHGLEHPGLHSLAIGSEGEVLLGTAGGGIYRMDGDHVAPLLPAGSPLDGGKVVSMNLGAQGVIWASLYEQGLARLAGDKVELWDTAQGLADLRTSAVLEARDGAVWVGHFSGALERIDAEGARSFGPENGLPGQAITGILEHQDGRIWIATRGGGAAVLEGERFRRLRKSDGLGSDNVHGIHEAGNGVLWFCTAEGLTRYEDGVLFNIGREHGLPAGAVYDLTEDRDGAMWLATDKGIVELKRSEVAALVNGQTETLPATLYDETAGMLTSECSGGYQHAVVKGRDGVIHVATTRGLVIAEPDRTPPDRSPPGVAITRFELDGEARPVAELEGSPRLGWDHHDLVLGFHADTNLHPRTTRYRYRLTGLEEDWIEIDAASRIRYPNLGPGRYRFEVQASNDGHWDGPIAKASFKLSRFPWQWTWLWGLLALSSILATWWLHRRTVRINADRSRKLEAELDAKARELREATLVDPLTGLRNRRFVMEVILPEVVAFIAQKVRLQQSGTQRRSASETGVYGVFLFDVDHFKKINDTLGHEAGDRMLQQFSYLLRRSVRQDDFVVRWGGEEFLVVLRFSDRDHLDQYARRVREQVERTTFLVSEAAGGALKKTASIGYVSLPFFDEEPSLLEFEQALLLADQALYLAKEGGRNRAVRAVSTGKLPEGGDLRQIVQSLDWAVENGFARLETFGPSD